jgi:hypothetical protein
VPKTGNDDAYTTGHGDNHCWTEQWWVETEIVYQDWAVTGYAIDCNQTSSCSVATVHLGQTCTAHTVTNDNSIETSLTGRWDVDTKVAGKFGVDISTGYSHTWSVGNTDTTCTTDSGQATCNFSDHLCHQIWQAQRNVEVYGYVARVCNGKGGNDIQQNTQNKAGKWVHGQLGFSFTMPVNKLVGCAALCGQQSYPDPTPKEGNGRIPYPTS